MKKSFVVIGLGRFGLAVVKTLASLKSDVLALDVEESRVEKAAKYLNNCVISDATKKNNLEDLGVGNYDHAIVAIGNNLQSTILTTIHLSELGIPQITVRIDEEEHAGILSKLGATSTIIPEIASAKSLANQIVSASFMDYYNINGEFGIVQIKIPEKFKPRNLIDLDARNRFDINIIGCIQGGKFSIPKGTDIISPGDTVTVVGKKTKLNRFDQFVNS